MDSLVVKVLLAIGEVLDLTVAPVITVVLDLQEVKGILVVLDLQVAKVNKVPPLEL